MKEAKYTRFHLFTKYNLDVFDSKKQWNKAMKQSKYTEHIIKEDSICAGKAGCFVLDNGLAFGMYINKKDFQYKIVIHESVHIIDFLMEETGINDIEFRAYMIEDLSHRIIEHFRDSK